MSLSDRLVGESVAELRADAKKAMRDFGITAPQPRNPAGRFATFGDQIRAAAGRPVSAEPEPPPGDLGVGRGGSALPPRTAPPSMSAIIRGAASARRGVEFQFAEQLAAQDASYGG